MGKGDGGRQVAEVVRAYRRRCPFLRRQGDQVEEGTGIYGRIGSAKRRHVPQTIFGIPDSRGFSLPTVLERESLLFHCTIPHRGRGGNV